MQENLPVQYNLPLSEYAPYTQDLSGTNQETNIDFLQSLSNVSPVISTYTPYLAGYLGAVTLSDEDIAKAKLEKSIKEITDNPWFIAWQIASIVSGAACAYHGYKRNESVGWAIGWFMLGSAFPVITPAIAVAQGFGKPKK